MAGAHPGPTSVQSTFWLNQQPPWAGNDLRTGMRLLSCPGLLIDRAPGLTDAERLAAAQDAERACFGDGFDPPVLEGFGLSGVAIGYASWAGVSYLPIAPTRAIPAADLHRFETVVQALWCYTHTISTSTEQNQNPTILHEHGWSFLRGCHSRLTIAHPRESSQHRNMRDAILSTSRLPAQLLEASTILRDHDQHWARGR